MKILFLSISSIESIEESGIYTDLLRKFRENGHNVYIVCPREKRLNKPTKLEIENGVYLLKVKIGNITQTNLIEKGLSTIKIEGQYIRAIKKYFRNITFDLIIYSTPPITFEKVIRYIKERDGARSYLLLKDIFPQNAVDLKMFSKKSIIYKYFRVKEKRLYQVSDIIGCMSQANVNYTLQHNPEIPPMKIEVCPNTIELTNLNKEDSQIQILRKKYNIPLNKTIFIYGGNLGKPQGIDFLIRCLQSNESNDNAFFVLIGSGTELTKLRSFFNIEQPQNALLLQELPKNDYEMLANSCDVGLIFLDHRFTIPNFPSRLLSYMNSAIPVLAATDITTDLGQVIENNEFGYWCESNDVNKFNKMVDRLCHKEVRKQMGNNARKFLEENYTANHSYDIIMSHFN